jgi:histidine kinase-like protein
MSPLPADLAAAVALGGEMGRRFAEFDWAAHPLGSPHSWPSEVRAAVATTLTSRFPLALWLGPQDLFVVYNEAYIEILGDKHAERVDLDRGACRVRGLPKCAETVAVTVSDTGSWVGDSSASLRSRRRGRGLTLIGGLADRVATVRTPGGTRVTLQFEHAG